MTFFLGLTTTAGLGSAFFTGAGSSSSPKRSMSSSSFFFYSGLAYYTSLDSLRYFSTYFEASHSFDYTL